MTHNHTHDADLIAAIDRLLDQGEPTGIPALDDLAGTVPRSRPAFEHDLETRLVAQLQTTQQHERKTIMQQVLRFPTDTALPRLRLIRPAYTLIAAALAVALFAVGLFVVSNRPPSGSTPGAMPPAGNPDQPAAQRSPTPTIPATVLATATPIPGGPADNAVFYYPVQPGDDCLSIAARFGLTDPNIVEQIATLNNLQSPCVLPEPGTTILIPAPRGDANMASASPTFTATPVPFDMTGLPPTALPPTLVPDDQGAPTLVPGPMVTATPVSASGDALPPQYIRPSDLRLVYIAARDIPAGTTLVFPAAGSALDLDVIATYWPADQVPASAVETLNGAVTLVDIPQWQPILADQVALAGQ
ncbi:LysM peptidoglycan-binding domain-containing protein [Aggregatilinea lenta]|uniref:LysM peptidoglycan-binding domain-containing protein n=1 Tax=Aggregatilinea lenta TaxID=913108 RepID=UPI000E5A4CAF|nr:LysM domain-containing protein [Aggregatilinea lenta]